MNLQIFSIYDVKAGAYITPFFLPNQAMAIRAFTDCINSPTHQFGANPADYTLFLIGKFSDQDAELIAEVPRSLGNGLEFVRKDDEKPELKLISAGGTK